MPRGSGWRVALLLAVAAVAAGGGYLYGARAKLVPLLQRDSTFELKDSDTVVTAIQRLARLESVSYHMERVIDLKERQHRIWGLLPADDHILLVAVGEVIAGVDLQRMSRSDVTLDRESGRLRIRLPAPEILAVRLDSERTYVHSRRSDLWAKQNVQLESKARQNAEQAIREAALEARILDKARAGAEHTVITLARSFGHAEIEVEWPPLTAWAQ